MAAIVCGSVNVQEPSFIGALHFDDKAMTDKDIRVAADYVSSSALSLTRISGISTWTVSHTISVSTSK